MRLKTIQTALLFIMCLLLSSCGKRATGFSGSYATASVPGGYTAGTDWQYFQTCDSVKMTKIQESDKGCYFYHDHFVYLYDAENNEIIPICSKNNCLHDKEPSISKRVECNAYLSNVVGDELCLMLYQNDLYACYMWNGEKTDISVPYMLTRISTDGSSKDEITVLDNISYPLIHRGYLYYYHVRILPHKEEEKKSFSVFSFYRMKLDGSHKEEKLYDPEEPCSVSAPDAYGNNVYFRMIVESDPDDSRADVYNIDTGEIKRTDFSGEITMYRDGIYTIPWNPVKELTAKTDIWHTDALGEKKEVVLDNIAQGCNMGSDSRYFYVNNCPLQYFYPDTEKKYWVYETGDQGLKLVDEFTLPEIDMASFDLPTGGDRFRYQVFDDPDSGEWGLYIWDKSSIGTLNGKAYKQKKVVGGTDLSKIRESEESTTKSSSDQDPEEKGSHFGEIEYSEVTDTYICEESEWTEDETDNAEYIPEFAFGMDKNGEKQYYLGYRMDIQDDSITAAAMCTQPGWQVITEVTGYYLKGSQVYERKATASGMYTDTVTEIPAVLQLPLDADRFIGGTASYRTVLMAEDPDNPPIIESVAETAVGKISRK